MRGARPHSARARRYDAVRGSHAPRPRSQLAPASRGYAPSGGTGGTGGAHTPSSTGSSSGAHLHRPASAKPSAPLSSYVLGRTLGQGTFGKVSPAGPPGPLGARWRRGGR